MTKPKQPEASPEPSVSQAVRTVSETDDVRIIEGLGVPFSGPFGGLDSYGTFASARTDFAWDLFPDVVPGATRSAEEPRYIRPLTYHHGFDKDIGLVRHGGWSPVRADEAGIWVQAQLDKRAKYYDRIGPLLDKGALGFSVESAEHAIRIDAKTGEWLAWPAYALSLTPTESNPYAQIAARSAETIRVVEQLADKPAEPASAVRNSSAANTAAWGASTLSSMLSILSEEADEPEQAAMIQSSIDAWNEWLNAERAEVGTPEDVAESETPAFMSAVRAGRRNSDTDQKVIDTMHDATVALGATAHSDTPAADDSSARSADAPPVLSIVAAPEKADAGTLRELAARLAGPVGESVARRMLDPKT